MLADSSSPANDIYWGYPVAGPEWGTKDERVAGGFAWTLGSPAMTRRSPQTRDRVLRRRYPQGWEGKGNIGLGGTNVLSAHNLRRVGD